MEINDIRPTSLAQIVGQRSVVDQLTVALDAASNDGLRLDDCLFVGPAGLGKSETARVISLELGSAFHEALGQSINNVAELNALLLACRDKDVLFLDEAHELDKEFQTSLYLALDKRKIMINSGRRVQSIPLAKFTLLLATTDEYCLLQPLRDRMKMTLRFEFYSVKELAQLLRLRASGLNWVVHEDVLPEIAQRSRGTPRLALRLLQSCRRVCRAESNHEIKLAHLHRACDLERIDAMGLGPDEQKYLSILADGPARLNVLATKLGLHSRTISEVTESFLLRVGLIGKTKEGLRELTAGGRGHVSNLRAKMSDLCQGTVQ